jgi:hypothetical protein
MAALGTQPAGRAPGALPKRPTVVQRDAAVIQQTLRDPGSVWRENTFPGSTTSPAPRLSSTAVFPAVRRTASPPKPALARGDLRDTLLQSSWTKKNARYEINNTRSPSHLVCRLCYPPNRATTSANRSGHAALPRGDAFDESCRRLSVTRPAAEEECRWS